MQANSSGGSGISGEQLIDIVVAEMMGQGWLLCFDEFQVRTCCSYHKVTCHSYCLNHIVYNPISMRLEGLCIYFNCIVHNSASV
jgi:hypothetical protein